MQSNQQQTFVGVVSRLGWMLFGPLVLAVLTLVVINTGNGWLTAADFAFLAVLGGVVLARWLEFRSGNPLTAEGEKATPAHLQRYVIGVVAVGLAAWVIANVIGNYVLAV